MDRRAEGFRALLQAQSEFFDGHDPKSNMQEIVAKRKPEIFIRGRELLKSDWRLWRYGGQRRLRWLSQKKGSSRLSL
jgi:hypothetical protein